MADIANVREQLQQHLNVLQNSDRDLERLRHESEAEAAIDT